MDTSTTTVKLSFRPGSYGRRISGAGSGQVFVCGRYLSIDASGTLLPLRVSVENKLVPRKQGEKFGFVDASGQFKIAPAFDEALSFSQGFAAVRIRGRWGSVDATGRVVIRPQFLSAFYFREGLAEVELDSGYALIDTSGKVVARGFHAVDLVADGRVPASRENKSGYLDLQGKVAIPFVYDDARSFSGGLAAVAKDGKWGYIDREGRPVIPLKFDEAGPFASGLAPARMSDTTGFIDKSGDFVFKLAFRYAPGFLTGDQDDLFIAESDVSRFWTKDDKFGYVNTSGRVIWGPVDGGPDHPPLLGWSEDTKKESCEGVPESIKNRIVSFPEQ